jgi:hypothetical protein
VPAGGGGGGGGGGGDIGFRPQLEITQPEVHRQYVYPSIVGPRPDPRPLVKWNASGGGPGVSVVLLGPNLGPITVPQGSTPLCPGSARNDVCYANPGTHVYTLTVTLADGRSRSFSATLTVNDSLPPG